MQQNCHTDNILPHAGNGQHCQVAAIDVALSPTGAGVVQDPAAADGPGDRRARPEVSLTAAAYSCNPLQLQCLAAAIPYSCLTAVLQLPYSCLTAAIPYSRLTAAAYSCLTAAIPFQL